MKSFFTTTKSGTNNIVLTNGNQTIGGVKTFINDIDGNCSGSSGSCTGNALSASTIVTGDADIAFQPDGSTKMTLTTAGDLGIGTASPNIRAPERF